MKKYKEVQEKIEKDLKTVNDIKSYASVLITLKKEKKKYFYRKIIKILNDKEKWFGFFKELSAKGKKNMLIEAIEFLNEIKTLLPQKSYNKALRNAKQVYKEFKNNL